MRLRCGRHDQVYVGRRTLIPVGGQCVTADQQIVGTVLMQRSQQQFEIFKSCRTAELIHCSGTHRRQQSHASHQAILGMLVGSFVATETINSLGYERAWCQSRYSLVENGAFNEQACAGLARDRTRTS